MFKLGKFSKRLLDGFFGLCLFFLSWKRGVEVNVVLIGGAERHVEGLCVCKLGGCW